MKRWMLAAALATLLAGCVVYEVAPGTYGTAAAPSFDRSWNAATAALQDQGVDVLSHDRASGVIRGRRGAVDVTANVRTQADGSVRVELNASGAVSQDPGLVDRISQSYERRMGR
jgi:hypothetical protein